MSYQPIPFNPMDVTTWSHCKPDIIAHDTARSRDRSTAVIGGKNPYPRPMQPSLIGIRELIELPQGLVGADRASALAAVDARYHNNAMIVADLSNDPSYAGYLQQTFGPRVIGLHITRHGDGMHAEYRKVNGSNHIPVYTIGRSHLIEQFHNLLSAQRVRVPDNDMMRRAYAQLEALVPEWRESGTVYTCPDGQHDDLGISCAMLVWLAGHPDLDSWVRKVEQTQRPPRPIQRFDKRAWS
jgi:hypothetical protein